MPRCRRALATRNGRGRSCAGGRAWSSSGHVLLGALYRLAAALASHLPRGHAVREAPSTRLRAPKTHHTRGWRRRALAELQLQRASQATCQALVRLLALRCVPRARARAARTCAVAARVQLARGGRAPLAEALQRLPAHPILLRRLDLTLTLDLPCPQALPAAVQLWPPAACCPGARPRRSRAARAAANPELRVLPVRDGFGRRFCHGRDSIDSAQHTHVTLTSLRATAPRCVARAEEGSRLNGGSTLSPRALTSSALLAGQGGQPLSMATLKCSPQGASASQPRPRLGTRALRPLARPRIIDLSRSSECEFNQQPKLDDYLYIITHKMRAACGQALRSGFCARGSGLVAAPRALHAPARSPPAPLAAAASSAGCHIAYKLPLAGRRRATSAVSKCTTTVEPHAVSSVVPQTA